MGNFFNFLINGTLSIGLTIMSLVAILGTIILIFALPFLFIPVLILIIAWVTVTEIRGKKDSK